jgi:hypothetical protein
MVWDVINAMPAELAIAQFLVLNSFADGKTWGCEFIHSCRRRLQFLSEGAAISKSMHTSSPSPPGNSILASDRAGAAYDEVRASV